MDDACFQMVCYCNGCTKKREKEKKRYTLWNFYQKYVYKLYELSFQKDYSRVFAPPTTPSKKYCYRPQFIKSHFPSFTCFIHKSSTFYKDLATLQVRAFGRLILHFFLIDNNKKKCRWINVYFIFKIHILVTHLNAEIFFLFLPLVDISIWNWIGSFTYHRAKTHQWRKAINLSGLAI